MFIGRKIVLLSILCLVSNVLAKSRSEAKASSQSKWVPKIASTWDYHLKSAIKSMDNVSKDIDIYGLDLFDNSKTTIKKLHDEGKKVVCYFSAGSYENWRPDKKKFPKADLGKPLDGWEGERWVNVSSPDIRSIMEDRIKLAYEKDCDAIDPDNMDGYDNKNGLGLTKEDALDYVKYLSNISNFYNLSMSLKNADAIVKKALPYVDFSVQEQCVEYDSCNYFQPFIKAGKAVLHVEYPKGDKNNNDKVSASQFKKYCKAKAEKNFSSILKNLNLDNWIELC